MIENYAMVNTDIPVSADSLPKIKLSWVNLNVRVRLPLPSLITRIKKRNEPSLRKKQILFQVNGEAYSGLMLAIMGESGSGKTTLLNTLAGIRSKKMKVEGQILLNGRPTDIAPLSAYVEQSDLFIPTLTVKEHLLFNGQLVLANQMTPDEIHKKVEHLLMEFGLEKCKNTQIGSAQTRKGISGGECRRLAIAAQVVTNPRIIFLDEPTSGLDSFTAESVVNILKKMALNNCAIISTIHQPSSQLFNSFDRLILLAEGKTIFNGPREKALHFFQMAGYICPANYNPSDFYIEKLALKPGTEEEFREIIKNLEETKIKYEERNSSSNKSNENDYSYIEEIEPRKKAKLYQQFPVLLLRSWRSTIREPILFKSRILQVIVIALIFGLIYFKLPYNTENIFNFAGAIFGLISNTSFSSVLGVIPAELAIFRRDHQKRLYDTSIYFLTKSLVEIPVFVLTPTIFTLILYFMIGLNMTYKAFFSIWIIIILVGQCGLAYGISYFISSLARDYALASALSTPLLIPLMIFGGFFIRSLNIPVYFIWISYISWFKYAFDAICAAQFKGVMLECSINTTSICLPGVKSIDGSAAIGYLGLNDVPFFINCDLVWIAYKFNITYYTH
ncbi:hypothetical protein HZS_662, partial [Henneguya salminicola]